MYLATKMNDTEHSATGIDSASENDSATGKDSVKSKQIIYPQRLVMIRIEDNCMFCEDPKGPAFTKYVHLDDKMGYIYCEKCRAKVDATVAYWDNHLAYGPANYLKNQIIQIKRSSGLIETGWVLHKPYIMINSDGKEILYCYNQDQNLARWCIISDILALNPLI
jgi:hypothetical protein